MLAGGHLTVHDSDDTKKTTLFSQNNKTDDVIQRLMYYI